MKAEAHYDRERMGTESRAFITDVEVRQESSAIAAELRHVLASRLADRIMIQLEPALTTAISAAFAPAKAPDVG